MKNILYITLFLVSFQFLLADSASSQTKAILIESIKVPIFINGKQIGEGKALAGMPVEVIKHSGDFVEIVTSHGRTQTLASNLSFIKENPPITDSSSFEKTPSESPSASKPVVRKVYKADPGMLIVDGGKLPENSKLSGAEVAAFQIGIDEVSVKEWEEVREWSSKNG